MKKSLLAVIIVCALFLSACSMFGNNAIGKDAALEIALKDAGVEKAKAVDIDVELESDKFNKWYEVEFDSGRTEYDYRIHAKTGEILYSKAK